MGTEILRPQDCLNQRLRFNPPSFSNPNPNSSRSSCRKQALRPEHKRRSPPPPSSSSSSPPKSNPAASKKPTVTDDGKLGKSLVSGHVKILKRGENLEIKNQSHQSHKSSSLKKSFSADLVDLKKKSDNRENLKKTYSGSLKPLTCGSEVYAGSTFDMSPSPRDLPLPKFSIRREAAAVATVDDSATQDLRRLLRIG